MFTVKVKVTIEKEAQVSIWPETSLLEKYEEELREAQNDCAQKDRTCTSMSWRTKCES